MSRSVQDGLVEKTVGRQGLDSHYTEPMPQHSLDVLRSSPVRGQLEAYDPRTPKGCRYIQTTDTYDELKVLLPPATAAMYEQLLKLEDYELAKKSSVSWERIMEIRHLKDRMIRKCQKLAKTLVPTAKKSSRGDSFTFQTFTAPPDFRLKEMEKWFRDQQKRAASLTRHASASAHTAGRELALVAPSSHKPNSSKHGVQRSITNPEASSSRSKIQPLTYRALPPTFSSRPPQSERLSNVPLETTLYPTVVNEIFSPPPLPVLILGNRDDYFLDKPKELHDTEPPEGAFPVESQPSDQPESADQPLTLGDLNSRPALHRKPSAFKRNSIGELKSVSWADGQNLDKQISQYADAARNAQASGKLEEVRALYREQILGLENLHIQVKEGLDHLRSETDYLQRMDETIRKQREALNTTFHDFEQKHIMLQAKVQEVLTEDGGGTAQSSNKLDATNEP